MKRQRTWKEYRAIDLTLLGLALAVFEFIIVRAANWWFPGQPFTVINCRCTRSSKNPPQIEKLV